jgi:type I restriction enzyme S subunit
LVKAGKIKKEKPLPEIGEDEVPFDLPMGWEWVRLGDVIQLISGQDMTPDKYNANEQGIPYLTGASNIENEQVIINRWTTEPKSVALRGDLLVTCKGTVGAIAFLESENAHIARQIMAVRINKLLCSRYVKIYIETYVVVLKAAAKSMIPGISRDDILNALLPLPPLAEQKRIVERVGELFSRVGELFGDTKIDVTTKLKES